MNWFTRDYVGHLSTDVKVKKLAEHDCCEHVQKDPSLLHTMSYENDSFGREGYGFCKDCREMAWKN